MAKINSFGIEIGPGRSFSGLGSISMSFVDEDGARIEIARDALAHLCAIAAREMGHSDAAPMTLDAFVKRMCTCDPLDPLSMPIFDSTKAAR